jgi:hypothetical protein
MDYLMKLVTTALEWTYQAGEPDVRAETLEQAAQLLVLRHDSLRIIDGAGPIVEAPAPEAGEQGDGSRTEAEREAVPSSGAQNTTETNVSAGDSARPTKEKCTFCEEVPIDLQAFQKSGTRVVECPDCGATRTLEPHRGVLRFKSHDRRKMRAAHPGRRWVKCETAWEVIEG